MNDNRLFVRDFVGVITAIAAVTTLALCLIPRDGEPFVDDSAEAQVTVERGAQLYEAKGCIACHTVDGTPRVGPTFLHDYGTSIALADGRTVTMNDVYIRESILDPQAAARPGYPPAMPKYDGLVTDRDLKALTLYIASLQ